MYDPNFYSTGMSGGYFELINKAASPSDQVSPRKSKRGRTTFSPNQVKILEEEFQKHSKLRPARRAELAKQLGLKESSLKRWFQNRRKKEKQNGIEKPAKTTVPVSSSTKSNAQYGPTQFYNSTEYSSTSNFGSGSTFPFYYPYNSAQLTQFSPCSSNYDAPTWMTNNSQFGYTQFPFCSSTYSPLIYPTLSTQFTQCNFANTYPSNVQPLQDRAQSHNTIEPINYVNFSTWRDMFFPNVESATSQPLRIDSTVNPYPAVKWNSSNYVADSEINSPLDFINMFHSN